MKNKSVAILASLLIASLSATAVYAAQSFSALPTTTPPGLSGVQMATTVNANENALLTSNLGTSAPAYGVTGSLWANSSNNQFSIYDGSAWDLIGTYGSGSFVISSIPKPTSGTLGGVFSTVGSAHNFLTGIGTNGASILQQPSFADISGTIGTGQVPTLNQNTTGNAGTVSTINGLVSAGTNVTVIGAGTSGSPYVISATSGGGTPGGSSGQVQYNNAGSFGGTPLISVGTNTVSVGTAGGTLTLPNFTTTGLLANNSSGTVSSVLLNALCGSTTFTAAQCASFFGYYDPHWYGALGNGQRRTDGTTTAAGSTLSSAGYSFTSADNSKAVLVWAGTHITLAAGATNANSKYVTVTSTTGLTNGMMVYGSGIPTRAYVTGVPSSTQFSISQEASATATGLTLNAYAPMSTTISSTSGGTATLGTTTTSALTGNAVFDFGSDDTTALNATDTAAKTTGGIINLKNGFFIVSNSVLQDNKVSYTGNGPGNSVLKFISSSDQTSPILEGINQFNNVSCTVANAKLQSENTISNFEIDGLGATDATFQVQAKGIGISCSYNSHIQNMYVHDTNATAIASDAGQPTYVQDNYVENCGMSGSSSTNGANCIGEGASGIPTEKYIITGNVMVNPAHYGAFIESETTGVLLASSVISGNIVVEGGNSGQSLSGSSGAGIANSGVVGSAITGNYIFGNGSLTQNWVGIAEDNGTLGSGNVSGVQSNITGNYVTGTGAGILVNYLNKAPSGASDTLIADNVIINVIGASIELLTTDASTFMNNVAIKVNHMIGAGSACFLIAGTTTAKNITINDNTAIDCGNISGTTDYRKAGFAFGSNVTNLQMLNNNAYDDGASVQKYGLSVNTGIAITGAQISTNNFSNNTTSALNMLGTLTGVVSNNVGMPAPTVSGCSATSPTGNGDIFTYTSGTTGSCAATVTPFGTSNIIMTNGYQCTAFDKTTPADLQSQTAYTTTSATITGTTVSGDVIPGQCRGF